MCVCVCVCVRVCVCVCVEHACVQLKCRRAGWWVDGGIIHTDPFVVSVTFFMLQLAP